MSLRKCKILFLDKFDGNTLVRQQYVEIFLEFSERASDLLGNNDSYWILWLMSESQYINYAYEILKNWLGKNNFIKCAKFWLFYGWKIKNIENRNFKRVKYKNTGNDHGEEYVIHKNISFQKVVLEFNSDLVTIFDTVLHLFFGY